MIAHLVGCPAMRVETFTATRPGAIVERVVTHDAGDPIRPGQPLNDASGQPLRVAIGAAAGQEPAVMLTVERCIDCAAASYNPAP